MAHMYVRELGIQTCFLRGVLVCCCFCGWKCLQALPDVAGLSGRLSSALIGIGIGAGGGQVGITMAITGPMPLG